MRVFLATMVLYFLCLASAEAAVLLDLRVIRSIESGGDPAAVNVATRCYGLYQISEICLADYNAVNRARLTTQDLFRPDVNEKVASWYFKRIVEMLLSDRIPVTLETVIACYNWGIGHVRVWAESGMRPQDLPSETRSYIEKYLRISRVISN